MKAKSILTKAATSKTQAIANRAQLIECVGVAHSVALDAAKKSW